MAIAQGYDVNREWGNSIRYARRLVGLGYGLSGGQVAGCESPIASSAGYISRYLLLQW